MLSRKISYMELDLPYAINILQFYFFSVGVLGPMKEKQAQDITATKINSLKALFHISFVLHQSVCPWKYHP